MENTRINIRGSINNLKIDDSPIILKKENYSVSSIRATAASITVDTGKIFKVSSSSKNPLVTIKRIK